MNGRQAKKLRREARRLVEDEELAVLSRTRKVRTWWYRLALLIHLPRRVAEFIRRRGGERWELRP